LLSVAIADHQPTAVFVPLGSMRRYIGVYLGLQRLGQHPPGALPQISSISDGEPSFPPSWPEPSPGTTVSIGLYLPDRRYRADLA
jgi:hypothetical protein